MIENILVMNPKDVRHIKRQAYLVPASLSFHSHSTINHIFTRQEHQPLTTGNTPSISSIRVHSDHVPLMRPFSQPFPANEGKSANRLHGCSFALQPKRIHRCIRSLGSSSEALQDIFLLPYRCPDFPNPSVRFGTDQKNLLTLHSITNP
jgi:hypothetical protein